MENMPTDVRVQRIKSLKNETVDQVEQYLFFFFLITQ